MNITEMISQLEAIRAELGDLPVCFDHDGQSFLIEDDCAEVYEGAYYRAPYDHSTWKGTEEKGKYLCL